MGEAMTELAFNELNHDYFELWTPSIFLRYLKNAGLDDFCDLDLCHDLLASANNILDIGAGYGRALHYIQDHFPDKTVTAVERSSMMCRYLRETFDNANMTIMEQDVFAYKCNMQFDCILLLWASICSFTDQEIVILLKQLKNNLTDSGYIVIDTPVSTTKSYVNVISLDNYYQDQLAETSYYCNVPSPRKLRLLFINCGFKLTSIIPYTSQSGIARELFIIARS